MERFMQVKDTMSTRIISIQPDESTALAARLLSRYNVGLLPVCAPDGRLQGVVTDRDIVLRCVAAEEDPAELPVRRVMSRYPATVMPQDDLRRAADQMAREQVRRLPVVEDGRLVGMVSLGDLAKSGKCEAEVSRALTSISGNVKQVSF